MVVVFGSYETALGVCRSLGEKKIDICVIDYRKSITQHSRYVKEFLICPSPLNGKEFIEWVQLRFKTFSGKTDQIPVFITSDDFISVFNQYRKELSKFFLFNIPSNEILDQITNKHKLSLLASKIGVPIPYTLALKNTSDINSLPKFDSKSTPNFPVFVKGLDVNLWRKHIRGIKGYECHNELYLKDILKKILSKNIPVVMQEIIPGPDTQHYKYCCYINKDGEILAEILLQKIRQYPIHFGVGSVVQSVSYTNLLRIGRQLFKRSGYTGVGSAEFKLDKKDSELKLIEINPRYWQQNYLATFCGMNFAYINYLDLIGKKPEPQTSYEIGKKWINIYYDINSYLGYKKEGLSFFSWLKSLKGKIIFSDFTFRDPMPMIVGISKRLFKIFKIFGK